MALILVIDPSQSMRNTLRERLEHEGHQVEVAEDTISGMTAYAARSFDLVLCGQPDSPLRISTPWIRLSRDASSECAAMARRQGAADFITTPVDMNRLRAAIRNCLDSGERKAPPRTVEISGDADETRPRRPKATSHSGRVPQMVGRSEAVQHLKSMIDKVAPTDARVLVMGSNGTGKELVARWLHEKSRRSSGPFVEVNCAAIPSELIESELFGHEKGAFTSAVRQRKGKFELAHGGTLFLDEIGDMSLAAQAKVLRVLQEKKVTRVGSDRDIDVDVRVIAATNKNIPQEIARGDFREDLFHRLSVIIIQVPSLADRIEDVPLLVDHFLDSICGEYGVPKKKIDAKAVEMLKKMPWTGNIRELRNVVERLVILCDNRITVEDVRMYAHGLQ